MKLEILIIYTEEPKESKSADKFGVGLQLTNRNLRIGEFWVVCQYTININILSGSTAWAGYGKDSYTVPG